MDKAQIEAFYPLTLAVRRLFHKFAYGVAALHRDSEVTVGMRAVLESVIDGGPQTVPHMAKVRPVTRQHIQGLVNQLLAAGLVEYADNPRHKRSKLVKATAPGIRICNEMRARETEAFRHADIAVPAEELAAATGVLRALIRTFEGREWRAAVAAVAKLPERDKP